MGDSEEVALPSLVIDSMLSKRTKEGRRKCDQFLSGVILKAHECHYHLQSSPCLVQSLI